MYTYETKIRVRYSETDQMGYVYYGNYACYYEIGRVETIRSLGINYAEMEKNGIFMPVISLNSKYIKPAFYDQEITIKTIINQLPNVRIHFDYELINEAGDLINTGSTDLVFIDAKTNRPCKAPGYILKKVEKFF